jgi:ssDNA-binding replication factor A large subunit
MSITYIETEGEFRRSNIDEIEPLEENINVVFRIIEQNEIREIYKRNTGETHRVCDFLVADETALIVLTLWQDDIDEVKVDQVYKLENGFANVFQNRLRLTKGRNGVLTRVDSEIDEINTDIDKSAIHVEDPRRKHRRRRIRPLSDRYRYRPRNSNKNNEKSWRW